MTIARLAGIKSIDTLLQAFQRLINNFPDVTLEIGGDGSQRSALEHMTQQLGIGDRVTFLGRLSRHQVRQALWRSDLFVLPSLVETFGVVLIEAMATGLPIIATRSGGPAEFVHDDVGWLVPAGDVASLVQTIAEAYDQRKEFTRRSQQIRDYAVDYFGEKKVVSGLMELYQHVIKH